MQKIQVQIVKSEHLSDKYSDNQRVHNVMRALVALNGTQNIRNAIEHYLETTAELDNCEILELYEAGERVTKENEEQHV